MRGNIFLSWRFIQAVVIILLIVLVGIAITFLFAPQKPEAPPRSKVSYEEKPKGIEPSSKREKVEAPQLPTTEKSEAPLTTLREGEASQETPSETIVPAQVPEHKQIPVVVTVVDAQTSNPITGAEVSIGLISTQRTGLIERAVNVTGMGSKMHPRFVTLRGPVLTNTEGIGELFVLDIEVERYKRENIRILARADDYAQGEEILPPISEDQPIKLTVRLSMGAGIAGRVIEEGTNEGASGVKVLIDQGANPFVEQGKTPPTDSAITDEQGNFTIKGLIPGTYGIFVSIEGTPYLPSKKEFPYKKVTITSEKDFKKDVILKVSPAGMIWGYITNLSGEPVSGAEVILTTTQSIFAQAVNAFLTKQAPNTARSDANGYYEMGGVPLNQEWRLYVTAGGDYTPQLSDVFALTPTYRVVRVDVNLFDGASVAGFVRDTDGNPITGAEVICMPEYSAIFSPLDQPTAFRNVTSNNDGSYQVKGLPPGNFQVMAWKSGYKIPLSGLRVVSDGFSALNGINLTLEPVEAGSHTVYGKVTNPQGQPLAGAEVRLEGVTTAGFQSVSMNTTTDSNGNYKFEGINIGYYELRVSYTGYVPRTVFSVKFDQPTDIILQTFGVIQGQVLVKETNAPLEEPFTVTARPSPMGMDDSGEIVFAQYTTEPVETSVTNPEGKFELQIGPGAFELTVTTENYTDGKASVMVREGETVQVKIFVSKQGALIAGRVVIRGGGSPQGTKVFLIEAESETEAMARALLGDEVHGGKMQVVGEDGAFQFRNLPEGNYIVIAQHEGFAMSNSGLITVQASQRVENITITLGKGGGIEGHIYIDGKPTPNALVVILGPGGTQTTTANESGYYSFEGLTSGVYQLVASPVGTGLDDLSALFETRGVPVEVKEGQITRFDFGRMGGTRIEGRCNPSPPIGGVALLRPPSGRPFMFGQIVNLDELVGSMSTMVNPLGGMFVFEDVPTGEWQLDIYYVQFGRGVRYVYSNVIQVTGEEPVVTLDCMVRL